MHRHAARLRTIVLLSSALALAACADGPVASRALAPSTAAKDVVTGSSNAAAASLAGMDRVNINIPTQFHAQNPCAGGRFGEIVVFTGNQHLVFFESSMSNGHLNSKLQWNADDVTGIGQYTGFTYRATGVTQEHTITDVTLPYDFTMINNYHIIGQGQATDMDLHETMHVTIDANGNLSAWVTDYNFSCHGDRTF
jgi:hypothetical protein